MRELNELEKEYIRWKFHHHAGLIIAYVEKYGDHNNSLDKDIEEALGRLML